MDTIWFNRILGLFSKVARHNLVFQVAGFKVLGYVYLLTLNKYNKDFAYADKLMH